MAAVLETPWEIALAAFPADGRLRPEGRWWRGQISGNTSGSLVDVRAWVGRDLVGGFMVRRPDASALAPSVSADAAPPSVAFMVFVQPPAGRHILRMEFFDARYGGWREGLRVEIESEASTVRPKIESSAGRNSGWMLLRTLRNQHVQPRYSWREHAQALEDVSTAHSPRVEPSAPLFGCLEEPGDRVRTNHGLLSVNGWVAHETREIVRVVAYVDPRLPAQLNYGAPRSDVAAAFGRLHDPLRSHFSGEVVVPPSQPEPWGLVIVVEFTDGEFQVAFARRVGGPAFATDLPGELPPYSARRLVAAASTVLAVRGWRDFPQALRECAVAKKTYQRHASPRVDFSEIKYHGASGTKIQPRPYSVVIVNDNFTLGGAALFTFEYARFIKEQLGWTVRLASPSDGPLRTLCDEAGIPVQLINAAKLGGDASGAGFESSIVSLATEVDWDGVDLVLANTLVVHWAVHLARACGKPSLLYVHESARLTALFTPVLVPFVQAAIKRATRTVFITEWTRSLHGELEHRTNFRLMRSWVDLAKLDAFAAAQDRDELRDRAGIPRDAIVMVCLGSICDRKGQRLLVQAIDYLVRTVARTETNWIPPQVLLVGARLSPDVEQLKRDIAQRSLGNTIQLVDETPDALRYLRLADLYVCPSFEEGFPRALMEAAAFELQIVTTNVCGIPELFSGSEAWLVPPGEPTKLAHALHAAMKAHRAGDKTRPKHARARVERLFNAAEVWPQHAALINEAVASTT